MSSKKKNIIKTYGKDMIAEMYLDLLNFTEKSNFKNTFYGDNSGIKQVYTPNEQMDSCSGSRIQLFDESLGDEAGRHYSRYTRNKDSFTAQTKV